MNSDLIVLVSWIKISDMQILKSAVILNRDTELGQNYMYWNEEDTKELWSAIFDFDNEVRILEIEEITDLRKGN